MSKQQQNRRGTRSEAERLPLRQTVTTTSTLTQRNPATGEWEEVSKKVDVTEMRGEFPEDNR